MPLYLKTTEICGSQILIMWLRLAMPPLFCYPLDLSPWIMIFVLSVPRQEFPEFEGDFMSPDIDEKAWRLHEMIIW